MNLSGSWSFQLDPQDEGLAGQWYHHPLTHHIQLPGSLQAQGYGEDVTPNAPWVGGIMDPEWFKDPRFTPYLQPGEIKAHFWLQPDKVYVGPAWYQREVEIPAEWQERRVCLSLERPHWETRAWLDGQELRSDSLSSNQSLSVPHIYTLPTGLTSGSHSLTVRVDNRMRINVGPNSHSMTDHTQTNWNGLVGMLELVESSPVWIEDVQVYPNVTEKSIRVEIQVGNMSGLPGQAQVTLHAEAYNTLAAHAVEPVRTSAPLATDGTVLTIDYPLSAQAQTWDEFQPALYRLEVLLEAQVGEQVVRDSQAVSFGLREIQVEGTQFALNGRAIFIRGTLECCIFPLTGYPPTDVDSWKRIIHICKSYGLNQIRFHSYCPPEAAFQAADELGFYYQVECASWANQGAALGQGDALDQWLYEEGHRITRTYGNHPSFLQMAYGNEPAGNIETFLGAWVRYWKARDPRRLYTSGAGWPALPENDYHNIPAPRIQAWGEGLGSRINACPPETQTDYSAYMQQAQKATISHEIGQWCAYPNFDEIRKYTGHIKAKNIELFRDSLADHGMGEQAKDFLLASGKLQVLCYKEDIESALRTPGFAGFHLLDLHDFPGQGTALVGVLDAFWEEKGYVTGAEYSRFCNSTVPLLRLDKRYWLTNETLQANVDIAHFGPTPLAEITPEWSLRAEDGTVFASGYLPTQSVPVGIGTRLGTLEVPLTGASPAQKHTLTVTLTGSANQHGLPYENDWDIWVFAPSIDTSIPPGLTVARSVPDALAALQPGSRVLLLLPPDQVQTDVAIGFSSIFWNTLWTGNQAPHTLGVLVDPEHPLFARFPTECHSNWQWWELIHNSAAMRLDGLPKDLRPLVQPIDTWFENRRLGLLLEARMQGGSLAVCSMDLETDLEARPVARQMLHSLLNYLASSAFDPRIAISPEQLAGLVKS